MKKYCAIAATAIAAAVSLLSAAPAAADTRVGVHIGIPGVYVQPAPVYVQPAPVYVRPQPVYAEHYGPRHRWHHGHRSYRHDQDRDGVPNRYDRDRDGDGVPNRFDYRPSNPYRY